MRWEKTVEYAFVQRFMPLSSTKEYFLAFFKRPDGGISGYQPIKPQPSQSTTLKQETQELAVEITHE
jgi:hypothetical protein